MDLSLVFDPVPEEIISLSKSDNFGGSVYAYSHEVPSLEGMELAIIGITENKGMISTPSGIVSSPYHIRRKLYTLKKSGVSYKIVDLGDIRNGYSLQDSYERTTAVATYLHDLNIIPIFIGGTHDFTIPQVKALRSKGSKTHLVIMDSMVDVEGENTSNSFLKNLTQLQNPLAYNISLIGHQSYLVGERSFEILGNKLVNATRLGEVKNKIHEIEPIVREADVLSVDLSVGSSIYVGGAIGSNVFGLTGEEMCQIAWYAGMSSKMKSLGIYQYNPDMDDLEANTALVVSVMLWYFIEGFTNRFNELDFNADHFLIYEVALDTDYPSIRFFKSKKSERWWMEVPDAGSPDTVFMRNQMLSCSYQDYQLAMNNEIPERWFAAYTKAKL